jgi:hypothetical protein
MLYLFVLPCIVLHCIMKVMLFNVIIRFSCLNVSTAVIHLTSTICKYVHHIPKFSCDINIKLICAFIIRRSEFWITKQEYEEQGLREVLKKIGKS